MKPSTTQKHPIHAATFGGAAPGAPHPVGLLLSLPKSWLGVCLGFVWLTTAAALSTPPTAGELEKGFADPPNSARLRAYWWWLNGNVTGAAITRDLEEMKAKGFGGALICDAGGADQDDNGQVPHGPTFFTPQWRELYKHTLREADRLGLEMSLNILSGWNLGGPMVTPDDAAKKLVWTEAVASGPSEIQQRLPMPAVRDNYYRDLFVVAYRLKQGVTNESVFAGTTASSQQPDHPASAAVDGDSGSFWASGKPATRRPIQNWAQKAMYSTLHFSAPDTAPLFEDLAPAPGEEDTLSTEVRDVTPRLGKDGVLRWKAPAGTWQILRFGCTIGDHSRVSTCSEGWQGYALDVLDTGAFRRYWDAVVEPLIADAGPLAGHALKYLHTDSWEVEAVNWTPTLRQEFRNRRGYDFFPFLPVLAGRIVDSRPVSNRFLADYRKTLGDLAIDHHYRLFRDLAHKHNLEIHPESGGPHAVPIDAQRCLGWDDAPMSEFWAWSWRHRIGESNRFFVKQPASAAHTYGHPLVLAEGFTTIGPHWQETLWDNLKPSFDQAACEGMNRLVWHAFVCSPAEMGIPGQQYFAGTHFNPNSTWWSKSAPFLGYINRCQFMLQQGLFVADACYYYGDHVPNFAQLKRSDPAKVLPGYDYDVATEEVVLQRMSVKDGRIVLPDGMSYRVLVLPERRGISLPVLRKLDDFVRAGATVLGPKPQESRTLTGYPGCDAEVARLADRLWGDGDGPKPAQRRYGKGRVLCGMTAREALLADGIKPDFEYRSGDSPSSAGADIEAQPASLDYIHRTAGSTEIYFVANRSNMWVDADCLFRVQGKQPELWDPVRGATRRAGSWSQADGRTTLPLQFAPYGSIFVVFRKPAANSAASASGRNFASFTNASEITGPWTVRFDPKWGGPETVVFDQLSSWTSRPEEGIKYYSGTATYEKTFDLPEALREPGRRVSLDLGQAKELAEVRINGRSVGVTWAMPFRLEITGVVKPTGNHLEIEVVNFWPNRIIGDQYLPAEKRFTRTNIRRLTRNTPLMDSGLLGPVRLLAER